MWILFGVVWLAAEPIWGSPIRTGAPGLPRDVDPYGGAAGIGVFDAKLCEKGALAGREPPSPKEGR